VFLVVALFQLHSFRIQFILWCDFSVLVFVTITAIPWNRWQASKSLSWLAFEVFICLCFRVTRRLCWGCNANSTFLPTLL